MYESFEERIIGFALAAILTGVAVGVAIGLVYLAAFVWHDISVMGGC